MSSDHLDGLMSSCGVTVGGGSVVGVFSGSASVAPAGRWWRGLALVSTMMSGPVLEWSNRGRVALHRDWMKYFEKREREREKKIKARKCKIKRILEGLGGKIKSCSAGGDFLCLRSCLFFSLVPVSFFNINF